MTHQQHFYAQMNPPLPFFQQPPMMYSQNVQFQQNQMRISYPPPMNMIQASNANQQMFQQQFSVTNTMPIPISQNYNMPSNQNNNHAMYPNRQRPVDYRNALNNVQSTNTTTRTSNNNPQLNSKPQLNNNNSIIPLIQRAKQVNNKSICCLSSSTLTPLPRGALSLPLQPNTTSSSSYQPPTLNDSVLLNSTLLSNQDIGQTVEITTTTPDFQTPVTSSSTNNPGDISPIDCRPTCSFADNKPTNLQMSDNNSSAANATIDLNSSINDLPSNSSTSNVATLGSKTISPSAPKIDQSKDTDTVAQLNETLTSSKTNVLSDISTLRSASVPDIRDLNNEEDVASLNQSDLQGAPTLSEPSESRSRSPIDTKPDINSLKVLRLFVGQNSRDSSLAPQESIMSALDCSIDGRLSISASEQRALSSHSLNGSYWQNTYRETPTDTDSSSPGRPYSCCFPGCQLRFSRSSPRNLHEMYEHKLERHDEDKTLEGVPKNQPRTIENKFENAANNSRRRTHSSTESVPTLVFNKRIKQELTEKSHPHALNSTANRTLSSARPLNQCLPMQNVASQHSTPRRTAHSRPIHLTFAAHSAPLNVQLSDSSNVNSSSPMSLGSETLGTEMVVNNANGSTVMAQSNPGSPDFALKMYRILVQQPTVVYYDYQMLHNCYGNSVVHFWLASPNCHLLLLRTKSRNSSEVSSRLGEPMFLSEMYRYDLPRSEDRTSHLSVFIKTHAGDLAVRFANDYNGYLPFKELAEELLPSFDVDVLLIASNGDRESIMGLEATNGRIRVVS
ncbi:hypothetical protein M3Y94_00420200 [Aphelenchoides besseyi]|nr:hypothetical protein M3Y94_00420200 [Aphelenchoides besseyi]